MTKNFRSFVRIFRRHKSKKPNELKEPIPKVFMLNDDCLEKIFSYLSLKDLYLVAEADERFLQAARWQFKRKIGNGSIKMDCFEIVINSEYSSGLRIHIRDTICVDKFFANFGPVIGRLEVYIRGCRKIDKHILKHAENCLAEIKVYHTWSAPKKDSRWHSCFWRTLHFYDILIDFFSKDDE